MQGDVDLRPVFEFSLLWLILGCVLVVIVIGWLVFVIFITRKRVQKTINTLPQVPYVAPDISLLKQKYLALIDDVEKKYASHEYTKRLAHQSLSTLLRFFVYEAQNHRVDVMTLSDLRKTRYLTLAKAIEGLYIPEFRRHEQGDVAAAASSAREMVSSWQ